MKQIDTLILNGLVVTMDGHFVEADEAGLVRDAAELGREIASFMAAR